MQKIQFAFLIRNGITGSLHIKPSDSNSWNNLVSLCKSNLYINKHCIVTVAQQTSRGKILKLLIWVLRVLIAISGVLQQEITGVGQQQFAFYVATVLA